MGDHEIDVSRLPPEVREKLAELDLELSEGDITQKGYDKKRGLLLSSYLPSALRNGNKPSPGTRANRRHQRRLTRDENRFHSEIRAEAVQQALAEYRSTTKAPENTVALPPKKRAQSRDRSQQRVSVQNMTARVEPSSRGPDALAMPPPPLPTTKGSQGPPGVIIRARPPRDREPQLIPSYISNGRKGQTPVYKITAMRHSAYYSSSDDDDSEIGSMGKNTRERRRKAHNGPTPLAAQNGNGRSALARPPPPDVTGGTPSGCPSGRSSTPSGGSSQRSNGGTGVAAVEAMLRRVSEKHERNMQNQRESGVAARLRETRIGGAQDKQQHRRSRIIEEAARLIAPPETTCIDEVVYVNTTLGGRSSEGENDVREPNQDYQNAILPLRPAKVSLKIQQVLTSLQRPQNKPLQEYYFDDDTELEVLARMTDPSAPRPEGQMMTPVRGEFPQNTQTAQNLPRSIDGAIHKYGTSSPKNVAAIALDHAGKPSHQITYGKLLSRANKVAYMLLNKTVVVSKSNTKVPLCKPGDRVALIYPNTEPLAFVVAFYGCVLAGVVPVPVEVPLTKRDAGIQQLGFLLGSCGVRAALTSESCYKGLPKTTVQPAPPGPVPSGSTSFSGQSTELVDLKGWPRLYWVVTEHLPKPSRDWTAPARVADESVMYIEYSTDREGSVKGVCVSRQAALAHARAVTQAMEYKEDETMVCVVDFKREVGLWHAVLCGIFNGMKLVFVPYSLMKVNPASWMLIATKLQATVGLVKSRDLHWGMTAIKDHKDINLSSIRSLVVADGANPWSLSSCDLFAQKFQDVGFRPDTMCPCAGSSETGTISLRRRGQSGSSSFGRGVLSMAALSHAVVRVDSETSANSIVLQDAGQVIPGASVVVVKQTGQPRLCKADEVGEICLCAHSAGGAFWGLEGQSASTFRVEPLGADDRPIGPLQYVRSGLVGFLGPDSMLFVVGRRASQMTVTGRQHSADDIIATVLAVDPQRFVYRGRIAVFSVTVLRDERIVIVAEQKPHSSEDEAFKWMAAVMAMIERIHQVGVYCLALVPPNQLPKTPLGGIHVSETRGRFLAGELHPSTLLMSPHTCVLNLPKPRERQSDVGPAAMFVGNIVQGVRIAGAQGRPLGHDENDQVSLLDILRSRAQTTPDHRLFTVATTKSPEHDTATCAQLWKRTERVGALLTDRARLNPGDHVALVFPPGIELIAAFYGCLAAGMVPVCVRPPLASNLQSSLPTLQMTVEMSKAVAILSNSAISKLLKSKEAVHRVDARAWPMILDLDDAPSSWKRRAALDAEPHTNEVFYLDFAVSTTGQMSGVAVSPSAAISICKSLKMSCELYPTRHVSLCLDPYSGLGFALWILSGVYSGHHTTLIPPQELETQPAIWLQTISQLKVRDTFISYNVLDTCIKELGGQVPALKEKQVNLTCIRTCVVVSEERARAAVLGAFQRLFSPLGLSPRALSTSFGSRLNPAICMQGSSSPDPSTVYVDARALRNDRVTLVGKGAPHSIPLIESGKILPGVKIVIANAETRGQCADSHLGEIWVASSHNASNYLTAFGEETALYADQFNARLTTGDTRTRFARTGFLGFLRQTQSITADGELHDAVFVVGSLEESLLLRGMRYHPADIETSIARCHRHIAACAVFTWSHLLVVVAESAGPEAEALDIVPATTSAVLEEQQLVVGVVVVVDPGAVPRNPRGEKQRHLLRDLFLNDKLDPIFVAYNT